MNKKINNNYDDLMEKPNSLILLSIFNFVIGGFCFIPSLFFLIIAIYGIVFSGDPLSDKAAGLMACQCFAIPSLIATGMFVSSGIGVLKLKTLGYYIQLATAVASILSIAGIPYGLPVLLLMLNQDIKHLFSKARHEEMNFNKVMEIEDRNYNS
jgi:hypothetical protein